MKWFNKCLSFSVEELIPRVGGIVLALMVFGVFHTLVAGEPRSFPPKPSLELALPNGQPIRILCFCNHLRLPPGIKTGDQLLRESRKPTIERIYSYKIEGSKDLMVLLRYPDKCEYWALQSDGKLSNIKHSASCKSCAKKKEETHRARSNK